MRISLALLLAPAAILAQQPTTLTLQDAISMAQRQGPLAQIARSTRDAARSRDHAFNARLLPQVSINGNAASLERGINPITQPDGSVLFLSQAQNQSSLGLSVAQRIPLTGGTLSISSALSRIDRFGAQTSKSWQSQPVSIGLQQDLFRPRTFVWDEKVQSLNASVAERQYLEAREDVAGNTAAAFFDLYAAQRSFENATANVGVNDTLYTLNTGRFEVGKIGENDLLKSELALLRSRAALDDAKLARDRAEAALRRTIDFPEGRAFTIAAPDSIPAISADPALAVQMALKNSSITEQAALDNVQTKRQVTEAKLNNRFNASINASVGFNQTASVFSDAYQSPAGTQRLRVSVNMPMIQWGAGRADVEVARANEMRATANNKTRRDALVEDARFSVLELEKAQRNVIISAKADTVAAKQFEVARNRYTIGKIPMLDLFAAQTEKDNAVIAYLQALRGYWTAYYRLRRITLYDFAAKQEVSDVR
jgi:outer membrane protein TolC